MGSFGRVVFIDGKQQRVRDDISNFLVEFSSGTDVGGLTAIFGGLRGAFFYRWQVAAGRR
jgi:hypothetical protein